MKKMLFECRDTLLYAFIWTACNSINYAIENSTILEKEGSGKRWKEKGSEIKRERWRVNGKKKYKKEQMKKKLLSKKYWHYFSWK